MPTLNKACITGIGWTTAAGAGCGRKGAVPEWGPGLPQPESALIKELEGGSRFGRLDLFSRIGLSALALALADAGHLPEKAATSASPRDYGLICATTSGSAATDHAFHESLLEHPQLASPGLFVYTLPTSFLGEAALRFALNGSGLALIEARPGGGQALELALEQLAEGDEEIVIAGVCNLFSAAENHADFYSGALFVVLEKYRQSADKSRDVLSLGKKMPGLFWRGRPCPDIFTLSRRLTGNENQERGQT
ncbi:MAG TPA: hypothetical protein ENN66_00355 [Proteobacteria bacterium]|nr:hypothetical protein [Pseudomonadota bacterium]